MARRHEDRQPGQRFSPSGGSGSSGSRSSGNRSGGNRGGPARGRSGAPRKDRGPGGGPRGLRKDDRGPSGDVHVPYQGGPARPVRTSKRRAQGIVVTPSTPPGTGVGDGKVRLNHFLAMSGVCSRRAADELIKSGRVEVNGQLANELGVRIDPVQDEVRFDGSRVQPERPTYVLFNKPKNVVCTSARHEQKKRVIDFLPTVKGRLFTVGRLDLDSEGLILLTNDGSFALEMTHPRFGVPKLYSVVLRGHAQQSDLEKAKGKVWLSEGPTAGMNLKVEHAGKDKTFLKVTLREGKNREIRRVFAKLGFPVHELKRIRIGDLNLHGLSPGEWRFLQRHEIDALRTLARSREADGPEGLKE